MNKLLSLFTYILLGEDMKKEEIEESNEEKEEIMDKVTEDLEDFGQTE